MDALSIACTTCQARLRVRDESALGQIVTCPKCGSMILVELPPNASREPPLPEPPQERLPAAGRLSPGLSDFEEAAELLQQPSSAKPRREPEPSELADTVEDLSLRTPDELPSPPIGPSEPTGVATTSPAADPTASTREAIELPPPNPNWVSPTTTRWRNRFLLATAGGLGAALALLLVVMLWDDAEDSSVQTPIAAAPQSDTTNASTEDAVLPGSAALKGESPPADTTLAETAVPEPAGEEVPMPAEPIGQLADSSAEPIAEPAPIDLPPPENVKSPDAPGEEAPPGFAMAGSGAPGSRRPSTGLASDTLRDFGALLESSAVPTPPVEEATAAEPAASSPSEEPSTGEPPRRPRPPARIVEVDDRLADPIAEIDFDGVPLERFLRFAADYSTIPITLDADMLMWAKLTPATPVRVKKSSTTLADVLTEGLEPLGLSYRIEGQQLGVTRRARDEGSRRTVTFKVADLVGENQQQLETLSKLIIDLVEPESWSSRGGEGTITVEGAALVVDQQEPVLFEVLGFFEKLRVARGLPTRSPYDAAMFRLESRRQRAASKLAQPISLTYLRPTLLTTVLDRLSESTKLHFLVDWRALAAAGWNPDAETTFVVANRPLAEALDQLLEPMDLTYRVVDASVVQITTPEAVAGKFEIEFYRVAKLLAAASEEELLRAAREAVGPEHFRDAGGRGGLGLDAASRCLIASLPQPQQLALQNWLLSQLASVSINVAPATTPTATLAPVRGAD